MLLWPHGGCRARLLGVSLVAVNTASGHGIGQGDVHRAPAVVYITQFLELGSAEVTRHQREDGLSQGSSPEARTHLTIDCCLFRFLLPEASFPPFHRTNGYSSSILLPFLCLIYLSAGSSNCCLRLRTPRNFPRFLPGKRAPRVHTVNNRQMPGSSLLTASSAFLPERPFQLPAETCFQEIQAYKMLCSKGRPVSGWVKPIPLNAMYNLS